MVSLRRSNNSCARDRHVISTPRLLLYSPTLTDCLAALAGACDDEAQRWLGWHPLDVIPEPERRYMLDRLPLIKPPLFGRERVHQPSWLVAVDPQHPAYAGMAMIEESTPQQCQVGGFLSPAHRGRGLGAELFTAIRRLAHHHLGYTEARAGTEPDATTCPAVGPTRVQDRRVRDH